MVYMKYQAEALSVKRNSVHFSTTRTGLEAKRGPGRSATCATCAIVLLQPAKKSVGWIKPKP
jgi:hypothetical protein